ncbi:uncharacterized protein LOC131844524 [Achroia grisella]|uniref:uncharacterized protein LOC131844524 n=1 Tax=Achroia grisella TaxID=688607 RepID=UPI0027D29643|nr:uncharacterized protein LOC131844524 [Achroia grisella]
MEWSDLQNIKLADPQFNRPNKIDILLGADVYSQIIKEGVKRAPMGTLVAQCTTFGWILSGIVNSESSSQDISSNTISVMHAQVNENDLLKKFWEIEDQTTSTQRILSEEEQKCEEYYTLTTTRAQGGRYTVNLPFRDSHPLCVGGNSRTIAVNRLKALERRLSKDEKLKEKYTQVIKEYIQLGHMRPVKKEEKENESVYLPHHAVIREDKLTSKVRVVFDSSCKNENGVSLNDSLMVGPTLQSDLRHIIIRWRMHYIGLIADIIKMYRQVRVTDDDAAYQRIVWRNKPENEIIDYELVTVTFGTASAPYLAVKTLHQVALDEEKKYKIAANIVRNSFYMDDLMTGCSTVKDGVELYKEMNNLLKSGGFILQKWNSNNKALLEQIEVYEGQKERKDSEDQEEDIRENKIEKDIMIDTTKILGLTWSRSDDKFKYSVKLPPGEQDTGSVTKRSIISDIARLFDPLGWVAPSVILAKIFIQKLWLSGIDWDDVVPDILLQEWETYRGELSQLTNVRIPRWLGMKPGDHVELHGFCDASKAAYAAVVYTRTISQTGDISVSLLAAKTKVSPIKQVSIPRLELCGAVLLARLLVEVAEAMNVEKSNLRAWTDSTVVLAWLNSHPSRWKTFVGNRVSEILTTLDSSHWAHISSKNNPADCASRGIQPSALAENKLWLTGPEFLREKEILYNRSKAFETKIEETIKSYVTIIEDSPWTRFSNLKKLLRAVSYCRRFLIVKRDKKSEKFMYLQKEEIEEALKCLIRDSQSKWFQEEYIQLKSNGSKKVKGSKINTLCPYIDEYGIMRVDGRLHKSSLDEHAKHPIILPHASHLTKLIIKDSHERTLHGGIQMMINYLRSAYWIVGVKSLVKQHIKKCIACVKHKNKVANQLMGSLPSERCTPTRPFLHTGIDYAGPINIRTSKGRGHHSYKGYICLFVCMATRAIHLEVVSDMSTKGFIAAFRRFTSRRGHCAQVWSDNGTNFVGAARELQELLVLQQKVAENIACEGTKWHFIPPHAPNFGGLWEAAVRSTKFHLKRVIGESTLTYEEMSTLLSQIEACLNSRPMTIINGNDPEEPMPLTPGHFLVGEPLVAVPDVNFENSPISSLTRWQTIQKMLQNFWRRWSQEYLTTLLHRYKWASQVPEPKLGDIVLVKESDMPPSRWLLGRIIQKHPGDDNITRVVTLKTKSSIIKRPTSKLCVLPVVD